MMQTFQYPNLLTGTRSGEGWIYQGPADGAVTCIETDPSRTCRKALALHGTSKNEFFMFSPPLVLHKGIDYTLHCLAANTANMSSTDIWVLDLDGSSDSYQWIGASLLGKNPGPGGRGSTGRSASMPTRGMACPSGSASTTTAQRTARTASSGSKTSCSPRARSRTHGHRQRGRRGLNER